MSNCGTWASWVVLLAVFLGLATPSGHVRAQEEDDWEFTPRSEEALEMGLAWLAANQGGQGNWGSNDLGLVSTGVLAFLAAGHLPDRGEYGETIRRALDYVLDNAQPSGLLNASEPHRDMYNHGLTTFVLGQAYGMTGDRRIGPALDRALGVIAQTQAVDGGWQYVASRRAAGSDLSLAVMQSLALRSAVDSGLEVPPEVVVRAIQNVRDYYVPRGCPLDAIESIQRQHPGQFCYRRDDIKSGSLAMAAAGVVCLQEFAQYDDWRIGKNIEFIARTIPRDARERRHDMTVSPWDPYTLYYVAQALYQVGGTPWKENYPILRDRVVAIQVRAPNDPSRHGMWKETGHVKELPGRLYMTSVACFVLAIPNRYLPILQEGRIDALQRRFGEARS